MSLIDQFMTGLLTRLNSDGFLSAPVAAQVIAENLPTGRKTGNDLLNSAGIFGVLSIPDFERSEADRFVFRGTIGWYENVKRNSEGANGARKTGQDCALYSIGSIHRYIVPILNGSMQAVNPFSMILISRSEFIGEDGGTNVWGIEYETKISITALNQI